MKPRERTHTNLPAFAAALALLLAAAPGPLFAEASILWRAKTGYPLAPDPTAFDLDLDGTPEIVLLSLEGELAALDPRGGGKLWEAKLAAEGKFKYAPVCGHFLGDGTIDIIAVSSTGEMFLADGLTGKLATQFRFNIEPQTPLATVPLAPVDPARPDYRDGLILLGPGGNLAAFSMNPRGSPELYFQFTLPGIYKNPPQVGRTGYAKPGPHVLAVNSEGRATVMSGVGASRDSISHQISSRRITDTWPALGDIDGDGLDDLAVVDDGGFLYALRIAGEGMSEIWESVSVFDRPDFPPLLLDVNGDQKSDVLVAKSRNLVLVNGASGKLDVWDANEYNHEFKITSPPAVFRAGQRAYAAFSDAGNFLTVVDILGRKIAADGDGKELKLDLKTSASSTPLAGPLSGGPNAEVFVLGLSDGLGILTDLGLAWPQGGIMWSGLYGGPRRASGLLASYSKDLEAQTAQLRRRVEDSIAQAREAAAKGEWSRAIDLADEALAANPIHKEARAIRRRASIRANLILILLGLFAGGAALALAGWHGARFAMRQIRLSRFRRAAAEGDLARAGALMLAVHHTAPRNKRFLKELADLYVQAKNFNGQTAQVFSAARAAFPDDEKYIKALASAYSADGRKDETSARAYADMVRVSTHPGPWAFVLGQAYAESGQDQLALEAFNKAARHGFRDPKMSSSLSRLYVRLGVTQPEILPTLDEVLDQNQTDEGFLRLYCRTCAEARKHDERAQKAAAWLLALDRKARDAHVTLGSGLLQRGAIKDSLRHAEAILEADPNDSIGLRLLGACYAAEKRLDGSAMQIFQRALASNPEAPELLVAVSHGYIQEGREDEEARRVYLRAIAGAPKDETILKKLAQLARRDGDDDLSIRAGEALVELGNRSRELVMQLAEAYARKNAETSKAAAIYREALQFQPDHRTIALRLANVCLKEKRIDAEAAALYETVFNHDPSQIEIGKQLVRACAEADLSEKTYALAQRLLAAAPGDAELQKLSANASASLDQMDAAISGFEQVVERDPADSDALCKLAILYGRKRMSSGPAFKVYQRAARVQPDNLEIHSALARAWAEQDNWDQAVTTIKHFLSHAPKKIAGAIGVMQSLVEGTKASLQMRWFLAETLIYNGRLREAIDELTTIVRIDPSQSDRALSGYDRILDKNPKDARAHQQRARVLAELNRDNEARQSIEQAARYSPNDESILRDMCDLYERLLAKRESPDIRFQLGKTAMKIGKYDLAISCFQKTDKDYRWENESIRLLAQCFMQKGMLDLAFQEVRRIPLEDDAKAILYELGQRYESVADARGAREAYKMIFAADIGYKDVKGKLEGLEAAAADHLTAERTAIINSLSEEARTRYELIQELGRGAMGIVYKARDNELDEIVALKILPDTLGQNTEALRRFKQEARNARRLSHPNIVRIHDIGEELGRKYISMEFVNGADLRQRMLDAKRNLPFAEVLRYAKQVCEALHVAHDAGIVHRDIKPANIMITTAGKVKVTDFGIAKMVEDDRTSSEATRAGAIVGTPLYMSPEQVQGKPVDHRADIYSLGIMLYELGSGYPPFTEGDLSYHHCFSEPPPMSRPVPEVFQKAVMKCLAKAPADRWQSARELLAELRKIKSDDDSEM